MSAHRKAPLPESMKRKAVRGTCRWCDKPVLSPKGEPTKGTWHPECVTAFKIIHWPAETRKAAWKRDRGVCQRCKTDLAAAVLLLFPTAKLERILERPPTCGPKWQHDHIRPLIEANGDPSFWSLENVQVLCHPCHVEKGKEDNARRKAQKQQASQPNLL